MTNKNVPRISVSLEERVQEEYTPPKQSANTLFRFFKDSKYLFQALEKGAVIPRYYSENVDYLDIGLHQIAYPMACFCDISIHRLEEHMDFYGTYGIAFSKSWGINKGIQPIHYINKHSILCADFSNAFNIAINEEKDDAATNFLLTQMYYMKPIEGTMPREGENIKKNFTDECEWRFIPDVALINLPQAVTDNEIACLDVLNKTSSENEKCWLKFNYDDVKYIILQTDDDVEKLCKVIERVGKDNIIKRKLISRIITWDNVKEDF